MMDRAPQQILLGVTGGIAAYKAAELVRLLTAEGCQVRVVMSRAAKEFVSPLTFQALSGHPVRSELFDEANEAAMGHIELARWADLIVVAPCSANFIAHLAHGLANDLLTTLVLASAAPVVVAPAMNRQMWQAPATRENVAKLVARGVRLIGPDEGEQACGEVGPGRMVEPEQMVRELLAQPVAATLAGRRVTITAGPTQEPFDAVRYITNRSSGKMGYAMAAQAQAAGAQVRLVSGPTALATPRGVERIDVVSGAEMLREVLSDSGEIFIACAAVADYRPAQQASGKIKKEREEMSVELVRNPDILATVAASQAPPFCVGFAAETEQLEHYARGKLEAKGLDMIAANLVGDGVIGGFDSELNALSVYWQGGGVELPTAPKIELAQRLIELIAGRYSAK